MSAGGDYEAGSVLAALGPTASATMLRIGTRRRLRKGGTLFAEGDLSDRVFVLLRGRAKIVVTDSSGRESVLAIRGPGDVVGELSAIDGHQRSASAVALEAAEVLSLSGAEFRSALDAVPGLARVLLETVVARLRDSDRKRAEFGAADASRRVARRLIELAERYGGDSGHDDPSDGETVTIDLPLSQEDLAGWTGASREAVSRAVGDLRRSGLIRTARRSITVIDLAGLRRRAV